MVEKRLTIRDLANNYNNKNLHTLVDDSHQRVAERQQNTLEVVVSWIL